MGRKPSTAGVRAARSLGVAYCVIGAVGAAAAAAVFRPDTTSLAAFRLLLLGSCLGFLAIGILLLVLARLHAPAEGDAIPSWIGPAAIAGGALLCLGLIGMALSLAFHPALWVAVAAVALIMISFLLFGLAAGIYRMHGGKRVG